jgi:FkbM family methyltransferase
MLDRIRAALGRLLRQTALGHYRRRMFEAFGSARYSRVALYGLDDRLAEFLPRRGVFVEAGANDGVWQSNTYRLERFNGWRGLLVEGIPELAAACAKNRRRSLVVNAALVSSEFECTHVTMHYGGLMSIVEGAKGSPRADSAHIEKGLATPAAGGNTYTVRVPARTITSILDDSPIEEIDLFSLDVEGYELDALRGLDLQRYAPRFLLIEVQPEDTPELFDATLGHAYVRAGWLSPMDMLYVRNDQDAPPAAADRPPLDESLD